MKELILHIGTFKTGTKAIQTFLWDNTSILEENGFMVPVGRKYSRASQIRNSHFLAVRSRVDSRVDSYTSRHDMLANFDYEQFTKALQSDGKVVLSDEAIWLEGTMGNQFWANLYEQITRAGVERVSFIIYLRRQDELSYSLWKQFIKTRLNVTFDEFLRRKTTDRMLNYCKMLSAIESVFGEGSVKVRVYDRSRFPDGDIVNDFCETVGIARDRRFSASEPIINPNLSTTAAEIKRWANESEVYLDAPNFLRGPIRDYSARTPDGSVSSMTPEHFERIKDAYSKGNELIVSRYFNGEINALTEWPSYDKTPWDSHSEETLRAIVQIFTDALVLQRRSIDSKIDENKRQAEEIAFLKEQLASCPSSHNDSGF